MSYVKWSALWHVVLPGEILTLCGRRVADDLKRREIPPLEAFLCRICGSAA